MKRSRIQNLTGSNGREIRLLANLDRTERLLGELDKIDEEASTQTDLEFGAADIELIYIRNLVRFIRTVIREKDDPQRRAAYSTEQLSRPSRTNNNRFRGHVSLLNDRRPSSSEPD